MRKNGGSYLVAAALLGTAALWFLSKQGVRDITGSPWRSASQISSLVGLVLMSVTLLMATRMRIVEKAFGGLDKAYAIHHLLGSISFILLVHHPLFLLVSALPHAKLAVMYVLPGAMPSYNAGIFALYIMILSFILMIFVTLPYHIWKLSHQLLGAVMLLGSVHALLIASDISIYMPLRYYMIFWIMIGLSSVVYKLFWYPRSPSKYVYTVSKIDRLLDTVNVYLRPQRRAMEYLPGQFAYISYPGNPVGAEEHPYSFSSVGPEMRFSVKMLGDGTVLLPQLKVGSKAFVYGPYGSFGDPYLSGQEALVWIAGGIGITPFLSMLAEEKNKPGTRPITLYYCVSTEDEAVFMNEIRGLVVGSKSVRVALWVSKKNGRLSVDRIRDQLPTGSYRVQLCGPGPMMQSLRDQFVKEGVPGDNIIFEQFQFT